MASRLWNQGLVIYGRMDIQQMKANWPTYKSIFLTVILLFGVVTLYTLKTNEIPRFILFLGRFHPVLLHLPIGALVVTFFIDILGRVQKNYSQAIVRNLLGFTAIFAIITSFLGYFLSLEGGYEKEILDLHFYSGIGTAILTSILFLFSLNAKYKSNKLFIPLFVLTFICIGVAGHFGSVLTHGENFLTEYAGVPEKQRTIETIDSLKFYDDVVAKIFDKKCSQCHNTSKQKGALSLISPAAILMGGSSGKSLLPNNASQSLLYGRLLLPLTDEEHMPPEGKEQLTKDELWLLKHWIDSGPDFENYVTGIEANDSLRKKLKKYLVFNEVKIPKASLSALEEVKAAGFRVLELVPGKAALNVKSLHTKPDSEAIEKLSVIAGQIVELDLSNSELTDPMTVGFKKFKNLKTLRLNSQNITDAAIPNFKNLKQLEVINIYNTRISDTGLKALLKSIKPKKIYAWKTNVTQATAVQLEKEYGINIQHSIVEGFVQESRLEMPLVSPSKTLFQDTIHIGINSRLKGVEFRYTLDGKLPDSTAPIFKDKLILDASKTFKIAAFKEGWLPSETLVREYVKIMHKITDFTLQNSPDARYPDANKLFDLEEGSLSFKDGNWTGYFGEDLRMTIDLGAVKNVDHISFSCLEDVGSWILFPKRFTVSVSASKNGPFKKVGTVDISRQGEGGEIETKKVTLAMAATKGRFFKIHIQNHKQLPQWHPSAGNPSWLFVDEIYVW